METIDGEAGGRDLRGRIRQGGKGGGMGGGGGGRDLETRN